MARLDRCLRQIHAVRNVAAGSDPPYVARSRIGRLCDSAVSLVAEDLGLKGVQRPGLIATSNIESRDTAEVAESCNRIFSLSRHIRQPSEPLDERWRRGWGDLMVELDVLERRLGVLAQNRP